MVDADLILWIRQRITLTGYVDSLWKEEYNLVVSDFLASKNINKLTMFIVRGCDSYSISSLQRLMKKMNHNNTDWWLSPSPHYSTDEDNES